MNECIGKRPQWSTCLNNDVEAVLAESQAIVMTSAQQQQQQQRQQTPQHQQHQQVISHQMLESQSSINGTTSIQTVLQQSVIQFAQA
ncbi:hypothetical protein EVAR_71613_1 [Eumeta japonica]|uniref:Uncharacterized protein n=1 Tax=Eumeta variegata TaxID=151549 RepID=A0A4C1SZQ4_EUMVA|nr:hypothetical protein EVAR_71613_1 [Eumeta japonica]